MSRPLMTKSDRADVFRGLAHPLRRRVLAMLSSGERMVSDMHSEMAVAMPALSRHLEVLRECGLVQQRKAGQRRYYRIDRTRLRRAKQWLQQNT